MSRRKTSQDMGRFLKPFCGNRDKEILERDEDDPRLGIHAYPSIKGFFTLKEL
jgi:hypothetical protein